jgi:hypothetical protein
VLLAVDDGLAGPVHESERFGRRACNGRSKRCTGMPAMKELTKPLASGGMVHGWRLFPSATAIEHARQWSATYGGKGTVVPAR